MNRSTKPSPELTSASQPAAGREVSYQLVHTGPGPSPATETTARTAGLGLCGPGWTLLATHGSRWAWSIRLDAHGAAHGAPARVAQAVAVRVLAEHGIDVTGWSPAHGQTWSYDGITTSRPVPHQRLSRTSRWWR